MKKLALLVTAAVIATISPVAAEWNLATVDTRWVVTARITLDVDGKPQDVVQPQYYNKASWTTEEACKNALATDVTLQEADSKLEATVKSFNDSHGTDLKVAFTCEAHDVPNSDQSSS